MKDKEEGVENKDNANNNKLNGNHHSKHFDENEDDNSKEVKRNHFTKRKINSEKDEKINSSSKSKPKSFFSKINKVRKKHSVLFYFIIIFVLVLIILAIFTFNCLKKSYSSEKFGYSTQIDNDFASKKIIPSNYY